MNQRARGPVLALYSGEQEPPHSIEAEQSVLGGLLLDNGAFDKVRDTVKDSDFYRDDHRRIFRHIARLIEDGMLADVVTVDAAIKVSEDKGKTGDLAYLASLAGNTPSAHNVRRYAEMVAESAHRRAIQAAAMELHNRAARGDLEDCKAELAERVAALADRSGATMLDLAALAECDPVPPRHIVPAWFPAGEVTLLSGHGGAGKSLIALHLAACIALGRPWAGLATERRRVLYVSAEDRADVLHWRLGCIARYLGTTIADLAGLEVLDLSAGDAELMRETRDGPALTALYFALRARRPQVLLLDGASDMYGGSEIIRPHVRRFVRAIRRLIPPDGAALILAHLDKAAARSKETGDRYAGSTAWNNSVRARWELSTTADGLVLALAKANHAAAGAEIRLRWDAEAHLYCVADSAPAEGGVVGAIRDRQEREGILAAMQACATAGLLVPAAAQGPRTAYNVLRAQPAFPADLGADTPLARRRFWRLMEGLRAIGTVSEIVMRAPNRHAVAALALGKGAS